MALPLQDRLAMNLVAERKPEQNRAAIDPWTVVHFAAGLAFGLMDVRLRSAVAAAVAYEVSEQVFERQEWGKELFKTSGPEILPNALVDVAVRVLGHRLGALWNRSGSARHSHE